MKAQIGTELPNRVESRYIWALEANSYRGNKNLYAVRPGAAFNVAGTNRTVTIDQNFEIILSSEFKNKGDNDAALDEVILGLYEDHEKLYPLMFQRNFNIQRVLVVNQVALSAPEIDNDNNIVSVTASFNVKYRTEG
jgi:hypothetical protein